MKTTTNYGLKKPDGTDLVNIEDLNSNMDVIDTQLAAREGLLKNAVAKTTLADADTIPLSDSAASSATKKITFANMKAVLKSYFDSSSHPASTVAQDENHRFTTDVEKANWNGKAKAVSYTGTIATAWSGATAPYSQSVTINGLLANDKQVHVTPNYASDLTIAKAQDEAWGLISKGDVTATNQLTFVCFEDKAITAVPIKVEVVR